MKKIIFIFTMSLSGALFSQINLISDSDVTTLGSNSSAFLDASTSYDPVISGESSTGKGLIFPQVDLTVFEFNTQAYPGGVLPTYYDGMVVYNTGDGELGSNGVTYDQATMGEKVKVEPGFYYFSNPNGRTNLNVEEGKWIKIADPKGFWSLAGNAGTTPVATTDFTAPINADPALRDYSFDPAGKNFMGTTDNKNVTFATGVDNGAGGFKTVARLAIGDIRNRTVEQKDFNFVMEVYGKAHFEDGIVTSASTYPDYVFDNYFTGKSDENPNYEFKKLNEVEKFIKENNHLPGVTSIKELTKSENGYNVDNTQLSIQTLEKVEELYLHVIEQQKEIQALKAEIAELKK